MKRFEMIAKEWENFDKLNYSKQCRLLEYILCPSLNKCRYDEMGRVRCSECKINWLLEDA